MLLNMLLSDDYVEVVNIVWATETPIVICFYFLQNQWSNVNIVFQDNNDVKNIVPRIVIPEKCIN